EGRKEEQNKRNEFRSTTKTLGPPLRGSALACALSEGFASNPLELAEIELAGTQKRQSFDLHEGVAAGKIQVGQAKLPHLLERFIDAVVAGGMQDGQPVAVAAIGDGGDGKDRLFGPDCLVEGFFHL